VASSSRRTFGLRSRARAMAMRSKFGVSISQMKWTRRTRTLLPTRKLRPFPTNLSIKATSLPL
jgi:hypothetical protein